MSIITRSLESPGLILTAKNTENNRRLQPATWWHQ